MVEFTFREVRQSLVRELRTYRLIVTDKRCPRGSKILFGLALGYLALPFDFIPDFIPVIGQLDDVIIVPGLIWIALRMVPQELVADCRRRVKTLEGGT